MKNWEFVKVCPFCNEENTEFISDKVECTCGKTYDSYIQSEKTKKPKPNLFELSRQVWNSGFRGYKKDVK